MTVFYVIRNDNAFKSDPLTLFAIVPEGSNRAPIVGVFESEYLKKAHRSWSGIMGLGSFLAGLSDH